MDTNPDVPWNHHSNFSGIPGMVWYSKVRKVRGDQLQVGDWLDTFDHRGARAIFGIFAGPAPAGNDTHTDTHLRNLRAADIDSGLLTVMVGGGETETILADAEYDVVDPDSQVTPDGTPVVGD